MFGNEGDGDDEHFLHALVAKAFERSHEGRLEPFRWAHFTLETEEMGFRPVGKFCGALFTDEANGFFDVARIGIALFDEAHGKAVGAENEMNAGAIGKLAKNFADVGDERFDVERMIEEVFDGAFGEGVGRLAVDFAPLFEAALRCCKGVVRVERKQDEFVEIIFFFDFGDGVFGKRLPVAHGGDGHWVDIGFESGDEFCALAFGKYADGRAAADLAIALGYRDAAFFCNVTGERAAKEIERTERDDVGVEEEIGEEGLDGIERVGST